MEACFRLAHTRAGLLQNRPFQIPIYLVDGGDKLVDHPAVAGQSQHRFSAVVALREYITLVFLYFATTILSYYLGLLPTFSGA